MPDHDTFGNYSSFYNQKGVCALLGLTDEQLEEETIIRPLLAVKSEIRPLHTAFLTVQVKSQKAKVLYPAFQFTVPQGRLSPVLTILLTKMRPWDVLFTLLASLSNFNVRRAIDVISSNENLTPFLNYMESLTYLQFSLGE